MIDFLADVMDRNYDAIAFTLKIFILRRPTVASFADIIKIGTMFNKTTFKYSRAVKRLRKYLLKCNVHLYQYLHIKKVGLFWFKNADFSRIHGVRHAIHIVLDLL